MTDLDSFLTDRNVIDVTPATPGEEPYVVIRHGEHVIVLRPMALTDHLCIDAHAFVDGQEATTGVFGMTTGRRHTLPDTGTTSHKWPSLPLVALLVGEQGEPYRRSAECPDCGRSQGWNGHPYARCNGKPYLI